jgi:hypothetical protein
MKQLILKRVELYSLFLSIKPGLMFLPARVN